MNDINKSQKMKKIVYLALILSLVHKKVAAQHVKVDNGLLVSSFNNKVGLPILDNSIHRYSVLVGMDYLDNKWFYLSSQVGFLTLGGKDNNPTLIQDKNFIHLNTTFRAFKELSGIRCFVGVGPYVNFLISDEKFDAAVYEKFYKSKTYLGGKGEIGFTYDINRVRLGLIANYMLSVTPSASSNSLDLHNNNIGGSISIGYLLRR